MTTIMFVQALFADQANISLQSHKNMKAGEDVEAEDTKFEVLQKIWNRVLPKKQLEISGDDIQVHGDGIAPYSASDMSDGERAIFYLIGQTLLAKENTLLIVDEPELHVHPSIMSRLWDELEADRSDCSFVFITHDLEFAAQRSAAKYVIRDYQPNSVWEIEEVPQDTGFSEELTTLILGSRKPILFVEGGQSSWDVVIYRTCYPDWTVIPYGSCEEVIHAVATMRRNAELTRVRCAGIVDADGQSERDIQNLRQVGVAVLPVSEIENVLLLPPVSHAIARTDGYSEREIAERIQSLQTSICGLVTDNATEAATLRYCKRRVDATLKRLDLQSDSVQQLREDYAIQTANLDVDDLANTYRATITAAHKAMDIPTLAKEFDNKGFAAEVARHLKGKNLGEFKAWIARELRNGESPELIAALQEALPAVDPA